MKLATYKLAGSEELGIIGAGQRLFSLSLLLKHPAFTADGLPQFQSSLSDVMRAGQLGDLARVSRGIDVLSDQELADMKGDGVILNSNDVEVCAPLTRPSLILAQGLAYKEHLREMGVPTPQNPVSFVKVPSSLTGTGCPIVLPQDNPAMVDWEGEFCFVVGRPCYRVSEDDAMNYVSGYTIMNDVSARDWAETALNPNQKPMQAIMSWGENIHGKQFPSFTPMGPVFVSADEIDDPHDLNLETRVNGEVMQKTNTQDLIFSISRALSYFSQWYRFLPGDIISTGSPAGVGHGRRPRLYLKEGDVVEVSVDKIGTLSNQVVAYTG